MATIGDRDDQPAQKAVQPRRPRVALYSLLAILSTLVALISLGASFGMMALNGSAATSVIPIFFFAVSFVLLAFHWGEVAYANEERLTRQKSAALHELTKVNLETDTIQRVTAAISKGPQEWSFLRSELDPQSLQKLDTIEFDQKLKDRILEAPAPTRMGRAANGFNKALNPANKAHTIVSNLMALAMAALLIFASVLMIRIWLVNEKPPVDSTAASHR